MSQSQNKTVGARNRRCTQAINTAVNEKAFNIRNDGCHELPRKSTLQRRKSYSVADYKNQKDIRL